MGPKRRKKRRSKLQMSRIKTRLLKKDVPKPLIPLFNHLLRLSKSAEKSGRSIRAGQDLLQARRLAKR